MKTIVRVAEANYSRFQDKIYKLNKRARRFGIPEIEYQRIETIFVQDQFNKDLQIKTYVIELNQSVLVIGDYELIGVIEHNKDFSAPIIKSIPGKQIPERFFTMDAICEHCNTLRPRKKLIVVKERNTERYLQVGTQCLNDFLGHDIERFVKGLSLYDQIDDLVNDEELVRVPAEEFYVDLNTVLNTAIAVIRRFGWISSQQSRETGQESTASIVSSLVLPSKNVVYKQQLTDLLDFNPDDQQEIDQAIKWIQSQPSNTEYVHNLKIFTQEQYIPIKAINYVVSLIPTFRKAIMKYADAKQFTNEFIGNVGERITANVTVLSVKEHYGGRFQQYFYSVKFVDDQKRILRWTTNNPKVELGKSYSIKAIVKNHETFNDIKQTIIKNVSIVKGD